MIFEIFTCVLMIRSNSDGILKLRSAAHMQLTVTTERVEDILDSIIQVACTKSTYAGDTWRIYLCRRKARIVTVVDPTGYQHQSL